MDGTDFSEKIITVSKYNKNVILPEKITGDSLAFNLYAKKDTIVRPGEQINIGTGVTVNCNMNTVVFYFLSEQPTIENNIVEISSKWIGFGLEFSVDVKNKSAGTISFRKDDLIGKMVPIKSFHGEWVETDQLSNTVRGSKNFGSTGID